MHYTETTRPMTTEERKKAVRLRERYRSDPFAHRRWQEIVEAGAVYSCRIQATCYVTVFPSHEGMPVYHFADVGAQGIFCIVGAYAKPNTDIELAGYYYGSAEFVYLHGDPVTPQKTLYWRDFERPDERFSGGHADIAPAPFPEHGRLYRHPFMRLQSLLVFLAG
jgi:hypothetical protein